MTKKRIVKYIVDIFMILSLPVLMAEALTGRMAHEWIGTAAAAVYIIHHVLNFTWFKNVFRGKYTPVRAVGTAVNLLLLADIIALAVSGIMMSGYVFRFLGIGGRMMMARRLHLFAYFWGLLLMSVHMGLHGSVAMSGMRKALSEKKKNAARTWILRGAAVLICAFGVYAFFAQRIADYLFLQTHFMFFDTEKAVILIFAEYYAIIGLFAIAAYYVGKLLRRIRCGKKGSLTAKIMAFLVPLAVCVLVAFILSGGNAFPGQHRNGKNGAAQWQNHDGQGKGHGKGWKWR